jgi:hypothetical protein
VDEEENKRARWPAFQFAGAIALATTLACVFVGHSAEQYAAQVAPATAETANLPPRFNAIDYATTASTTKGATIVIGPCDTRPR